MVKGRDYSSAKGAVSCEPGASPQESDSPINQALKARLNPADGFQPQNMPLVEITPCLRSNPIVESRFQRSCRGGHESLGRCPRLAVESVLGGLAIECGALGAKHIYTNAATDILP